MTSTAIFLIAMLSALLPAAASAAPRCSPRELAQILGGREPSGPGRTVEVTEQRSLEGGQWTLKPRSGVTVFARREDFGEMGKSQIDYYFLNKDAFFVSVKTFMYAKPLTAAMMRLTDEHVYVFCRGIVWIPAAPKPAPVSARDEFEVLRQDLRAPELRGLVFGSR